jgi:hypothetical protein
MPRLSIEITKRTQFKPVLSTRMCPLLRALADQDPLFQTGEAMTFWSEAGSAWLIRHDIATRLTLLSEATYDEARYFIDRFIDIKNKGHRVHIFDSTMPSWLGASVPQ